MLSNHNDKGRDHMKLTPERAKEINSTVVTDFNVIPSSCQRSP